MNKDQVQGTAKNIVGKVQEETGKMLGNDRQQINGLNKKVMGKIQESVGDIEEIINSHVRKI